MPAEDVEGGSGALAEEVGDDWPGGEMGSLEDMVSDGNVRVVRECLESGV